VKPVKNAFQNIENGRHRFAELEIDPFDALDANELANSTSTSGSGDARFAEHAEDARLGETVHLLGDDIGRFARLREPALRGAVPRAICLRDMEWGPLGPDSRQPDVLIGVTNETRY
jgi:hypothetical protein